MPLETMRNLIRDVPDFPKPGIVFKDITPLVANPVGFRHAIEFLGAALERHSVDGLVAIESRGFIFGAAVANHMGIPLSLVRKPGKLPYKTVGLNYDLEYGSDRIEIHTDAITKGARYAIVDDLIATGGTARATEALIEQQGGVCAVACFVIELSFLGGAKSLRCPTESILSY